jgi:hypothetical protein
MRRLRNGGPVGDAPIAADENRTFSGGTNWNGSSMPQVAFEINRQALGFGRI